MRIILGVVLLVCCGCASARYVSKGPNEGVVAIPCDNQTNRRKAEELMANHFPSGYEVIFEEETPVGTVTHVQKKTQDEGIALMSFQPDPDSEHQAGLKLNLPGATHRHTHATYTTEDKTEWRIHYRKKYPYLATPPGRLTSESLQQHFDPLDVAEGAETGAAFESAK